MEVKKSEHKNEKGIKEKRRRKQKFTPDKKQPSMREFLSPTNLKTQTKEVDISVHPIDFKPGELLNSPSTSKSPIKIKESNLETRTLRSKKVYNEINATLKVKPRKGKRDENCNSVEAEVIAMRKEWAKYDEKLENLAAVCEISKQIDKDIREREEEKKREEEKRLERIEKRKNFIVKDCKHLTEEDINSYFYRNLQWLDDTLHGKRHCERHKLYYEGKLRSPYFHVYNYCYDVYTDEQINLFIKLFRNRYDNGSYAKYSNYYWAVLLPEFTLKIFTEIYNMSEDEAIDYIKSIPGQDDALDYNF